MFALYSTHLLASLWFLNLKPVSFCRLSGCKVDFFFFSEVDKTQTALNEAHIKAKKARNAAASLELWPTSTFMIFITMPSGTCRWSEPPYLTAARKVCWEPTLAFKAFLDIFPWILTSGLSVALNHQQVFLWAAVISFQARRHALWLMCSHFI